MSRRKRITIYDVAQEVGLSVSTVSRVLNNSTLISDEKAELIRKVATRMGYIKRPIRRQSSRTILNVKLFLPLHEESALHLFYDAPDLIDNIKRGFGETRVNIVAIAREDRTETFDNKRLGQIDGCPLQKTPGQGRTGIAFKDRGGLLTAIDIKDLVDALTGAPLHLKAGLFQCRRCRAFYQDQSVAVIRAENCGRCVSCLHEELVRVMGRREQRGRTAKVDAVTFLKYRQYIIHDENHAPGNRRRGNLNPFSV